MRSYRDYRGEPHAIYYEVLEIKEKNEHVKVKVPVVCVPLEELHSSRKSVSISSVATSIHLKYAPLVLVGYYHLIHISTLETNRLNVSIKGTPKQPCKTEHRLDVLQEGGTISNLGTMLVSVLDSRYPGTQSST